MAKRTSVASKIGLTGFIVVGGCFAAISLTGNFEDQANPHGQTQCEPGRDNDLQSNPLEEGAIRAGEHVVDNYGFAQGNSGSEDCDLGKVEFNVEAEKTDCGTGVDALKSHAENPGRCPDSGFFDEDLEEARKELLNSEP